VAYINSDSNGRGFFGLEGSHTLEHFINDVARDVQDPETKLSIWKRAQLAELQEAKTAEAQAEVRNRPDLRLDMLGGDRITPHSSISRVWHLSESASVEKMAEAFITPSTTISTGTRISATLISSTGAPWRRPAEPPLCAWPMLICFPGNLPIFADDVKMYVTEVKKFSVEQRAEIQRKNQEIADGVYEATSDPRQTWVTPKKEEMPPHINFAPLDNAVESLERSSAEYQKALERVSANGGAGLASNSLQGVNALLMQSEHKLTTPEGLPGRFWFKHELYAPGVYTGYAAKAIPAVRESLEQKKMAAGRRSRGTRCQSAAK